MILLLLTRRSSSINQLIGVTGENNWKNFYENLITAVATFTYSREHNSKPRDPRRHVYSAMVSYETKFVMMLILRKFYTLFLQFHLHDWA